MPNNSLQIDAFITENGNIVINFKAEQLTIQQVQKIMSKISSIPEETIIVNANGAFKINRNE